MLGVEDYWNMEIMFAAGHFHDVCISKEGHTEGVPLPLKTYYKNREKDSDRMKFSRHVKYQCRLTHSGI